MKIYKFNSLTTLIFSTFILGLVVFLPIVLIETLWNSTVGRTYTNITIDFWQALILWLVLLVVLYIFGLFKFEFAIEKHEGLNNELLKKQLQNLQTKTDKKTEISENKDKEDSK